MHHKGTHSYKVILNGQNPLPGDNSAKYFAEKIIKEIKKEDWLIEVHMHKVKAHSRVRGNENADSFAKAGAMKAPRIPPLLLQKSVHKDDAAYSLSFSTSFSSCDWKRTRLSQTRFVENPIH